MQGQGACDNGFECYDLIVRCRDLPARRASVQANQFSGSNGAVIFVGGGFTREFMFGGYRGFLVNNGLEFYSIAFPDEQGYLTGVEGAGLKNVSCAASEIIKFIAAELADNPSNLGAFGTSAGSMQLGYGLTLHGLQGVLQLVLLTAGPVQADLVASCFDYSTPGRGLSIDLALGWSGDGDYCQNGSGPDSLIGILRADSIVAASGAEKRRNYDYRDTSVVFIQGQDDEAAVELGRVFYDAITSEKTWIVIAGAGHAVAGHPDGIEATIQGIVNGLGGE